MSNWSRIWKSAGGVDFNRETCMWKFYELLLDGYDFKGKRVLEFGCGTGINSVFMAAMGARVTFLDNSREALKLVKRNLDGFSLDGDLVYGDVFDSGFESEFDVVHSEGLIEHFIGKQRQKILDIHAEAAKKHGKIVIIVPNLKSPGYRIGKFLAEKTNTWIYGNEYPYSESELKKRMELAGLKLKKIIGGGFFSSFAWILCPLWLPSTNMVKNSMSLPTNSAVMKVDYNNMFADKWGRVIGAVGEKQ